MAPFPTFTDVLHARQIIAPWLPVTPLFSYPQLDQALGFTLFLKHENYQPVGAFKVRGGITFMAQLPEVQRRRGVVTASTGNHGQSVAFAARLFGVRAIICVPHGANPVKVEAMQALGAEVRFAGANFEESKLECARLEAQEGLYFLSSGDEPALIAGVATHTLELLEQQPGIEVLLVPIGGGSGAAGATLVAKTINPAIEVIAVGAAGAPAGYLSWQAKAEQLASIDTFAAGLATGRPFHLPYQILWKKLDDFVLVDDMAMKWAVRIALEKAKTLVEPAGAASLAAAIALRERLAGKQVAAILSGGNISPAEMELCLRETADPTQSPLALPALVH